MSKNEVLNYLYSVSDEKYKTFSKKITPGEFKMIGVRIPILKSLAKKIYKEDYLSFLKIDDENIFELVMLKGLVIANIKDIEEYKNYFNSFLPKINNWAICDIFLASSKVIKKDMTYFWNISLELINKKDEFMKRVGLVILLDYFVNDEYIDRIIETIKNFKCDAYYANMALAWLISVMYIKYPDKTKKLLLNNSFDTEVIKMSIRKIKDSYRVSLENKDWLKNIN